MYWRQGTRLTGGLVPGAERLSIALCTWVCRFDHALVRICWATTSRFTWLGSTHYAKIFHTLPLIREYHHCLPLHFTARYRNVKGVAQFKRACSARSLEVGGNEIYFAVLPVVTAFPTSSPSCNRHLER